MQKIILFAIAVLMVTVFALSCSPKRWIQGDPRTVTPEPTVVVDERVRVDINGNTLGAE